VVSQNFYKLIILSIFFCVCLLNNSSFASKKIDYIQPVTQPYIFSKNKPTSKMEALGRVLFFDVRLSGNNKMSCASCHQPDKFWTDGLKTGKGLDGIKLLRATPTLINAAYNTKQFWDGRALSLEQQSTMPIESPLEMNQKLDNLVIELKQIPGYVKLFKNVFNDKQISKPNIGRAIGAFQRTLISKNTDFDRWYAGDESAMGDSAKRGFKLFENKAECVKCHSGFNFTDNKFHNIGLKITDYGKDLGRYEIDKQEKMKYAFKTPSLRNVTKTPPYMHNGIYTTMTEVIEHYNRGGDNKINLNKNINELNLTKQEIEDIIAFLETLVETVSVAIPQTFPQ